MQKNCPVLSLYPEGKTRDKAIRVSGSFPGFPDTGQGNPTSPFPAAGWNAKENGSENSMYSS
jgi:hypothetical protein